MDHITNRADRCEKWQAGIRVGLDAAAIENDRPRAERGVVANNEIPLSLRIRRTIQDDVTVEPGIHVIDRRAAIPICERDAGELMHVIDRADLDVIPHAKLPRPAEELQRPAARADAINARGRRRGEWTAEAGVGHAVQEPDAARRERASEVAGLVRAAEEGDSGAEDSLIHRPGKADRINREHRGERPVERGVVESGHARQRDVAVIICGDRGEAVQVAV